MTTDAYAFGSLNWPGLCKLLEESGEVQQVIGKLVATGGKAEHWDGSNLDERLEEELGDLLAALDFVIEVNTRLDDERIQARRAKKLKLFRHWHDPSEESPLAPSGVRIGISPGCIKVDHVHGLQGKDSFDFYISTHEKYVRPTTPEGNTLHLGVEPGRTRRNGVQLEEEEETETLLTFPEGWYVVAESGGYTVRVIGVRMEKSTHVEFDRTDDAFEAG